MSHTDELLKNSQLSEKVMLRELETILLYYENMELKCKLVKANETAPLPSLVALLEPDDEGRPRVLTHSFLPLDQEDAEFTKYLQFYCELPASLDDVDRLLLLEALLRLNEALPFGAATLVGPRPELGLPLMAAVRTVQGFPLNQPIDEGVFTEDMFLFDLSCELVSKVLNSLREGKSLDEAFDLTGQ